MPARGFCQHGKVWTTCPICGKEVIAAASKRGMGVGEDFVPAPRVKKKPPAEEEAAPEPEPAEETES